MINHAKLTWHIRSFWFFDGSHDLNYFYGSFSTTLHNKSLQQKIHGYCSMLSNWAERPIACSKCAISESVSYYGENRWANKVRNQNKLRFSWRLSPSHINRHHIYPYLEAKAWSSMQGNYIYNNWGFRVYSLYFRVFFIWAL